MDFDLSPRNESESELTLECEFFLLCVTAVGNPLTSFASKLPPSPLPFVAIISPRYELEKYRS